MTPNAALAAFQASANWVSAGAELLNMVSQRKAAEIEQREIGLRIQEEQLAATQASYQATKEMRKVLASQAVIAGARGQATGAGSQLALLNDSWRAFEEDEDARRMNLASTTFNLKSKQGASKVNTQAGVAAGFGKIAQGLFNQTSTNKVAEKFGTLGNGLSLSGLF